MGLEMWVQAFIGGIIGLLLMPVGNIISDIISAKKQPDITGKWLSTWEIKDGSDNWACEELIIKKHFGKFVVDSLKNDHNHSYSGKFEISLNHTVIGKLSSVKKGATTEGTSLLYIASQGNCLYGMSFAPNPSGIPVIRKWVLGKSDENLEFGKYLLL